MNAESIRLFRSNMEVPMLGNVWGSTPLHMASHGGHTAVVELLAAAPGIDVNRVDAWGETPLYVACRKGHADVVRVLLAVEATDVNLANHHGTTPLVAARSGGHGEVAGMVEAAGGRCEYTLLSASYEGNADEVARAVARLGSDGRGGDVNEADAGGRTALFLAAGMGNCDAVRELVRAPGIDVNRVDRNGETALYCAAVLGHTPVVAELVKVAAVHVDATDAHGRTPLWAACWDGNVERLALEWMASGPRRDPAGDPTQRRRGPSPPGRRVPGLASPAPPDRPLRRPPQFGDDPGEDLGIDRMEEEMREMERHGRRMEMERNLRRERQMQDNRRAARRHALRMERDMRMEWDMRVREDGVMWPRGLELPDFYDGEGPGEGVGEADGDGSGEAGGEGSGETDGKPTPPRGPRAPLIRALLEAGADVNRASNDGITPWHLFHNFAPTEEHVAMVRRAVAPILVTLVAGGLPYTAANKIAILALQDDKLACRALLMRAGARLG